MKLVTKHTCPISDHLLPMLTNKIARKERIGCTHHGWGILQNNVHSMRKLYFYLAVGVCILGKYVFFAMSYRVVLAEEMHYKYLWRYKSQWLIGLPSYKYFQGINIIVLPQRSRYEKRWELANLVQTWQGKKDVNK